MKPIHYLLVLLFLSRPVFGQKKLSQQEVFQGVISFYDKFEKKQPRGNKAYVFDYTMQITPGEYVEGFVSTTKTKLILADKFKIVKSENMEMYQDTNETFLVLNNQKMVVRSATPKRDGGPEVKHAFSQIPGKLLKASEIVSAGLVDLQGKSVYRIKLNVKESFTKMTAVKNLYFWYNPEDGNVVKMEAVYVPGYKFKSVRVYLENIDLNHKVPSTEAINYVMRRGSLINSLKSYKYIDNR